ncbi:RING finger domain protein [Klosneuvirus KNV1]|uniref:RING finger domain protein n=1 Tax=Klosneuvirus KNV1 TaxID=1977640 RepID=A0A1V0SK66_9VIRU|nr:RING finger domain protein [Klosneuvirus KNV1]
MINIKNVMATILVEQLQLDHLFDHYKDPLKTIQQNKPIVQPIDQNIITRKQNILKWNQKHENIVTLYKYLSHFKQNTEEFYGTFKQYRTPWFKKIGKNIYMKEAIGCVSSEEHNLPFYYYCEIRDGHSNQSNLLNHPICIKFDPKDGNIALTDEIKQLHKQGKLCSITDIGKFFDKSKYQTNLHYRQFQSKTFTSITKPMDIVMYIEKLIEDKSALGIKDALNLNALTKIKRIEIITHMDKENKKMTKREKFIADNSVMTRRTVIADDLDELDAKATSTKIKITKGDEVTTIRYLINHEKLTKTEIDHNITSISFTGKGCMIKTLCDFLGLQCNNTITFTDKDNFDTTIISGVINLLKKYNISDDYKPVNQVKHNINVESIYKILSDYYLHYHRQGELFPLKYDFANGQVYIKTVDLLTISVEFNNKRFEIYVIKDNDYLKYVGKIENMYIPEAKTLSYNMQLVHTYESIIGKMNDKDVHIQFDKQYMSEYIGKLNLQINPHFENIDLKFIDSKVCDIMVSDNNIAKFYCKLMIEYNEKIVYIDHFAEEIETFYKNNQCELVYLQNNATTVIKGQYNPRSHMNGTTTTTNGSDNKTYDIKYDQVKRTKYDEKGFDAEYTIDNTGTLVITTKPPEPKPPKKYGFKAAYSSIDGSKCIVKLELLPDSKVATDGYQDKLRTNKAQVIGIFKYKSDWNSKVEYIYPSLNEAYSGHDRYFKYRLGETVSVYNFDPNLHHVCVPGIHFFMKQEDALRFHGTSTSKYNISEYEKMDKYDTDNVNNDDAYQSILIPDSQLIIPETKEEKYDNAGSDDEDAIIITQFDKKLIEKEIKEEKLVNKTNLIIESDDEEKNASSDNEDQCKVCYDKQADTIIMECQHQMCKRCFDAWIVLENTCPFCRGNIDYYLDK